MKQFIYIFLIALLAACSGIEDGENDATAVPPSPANSQTLTGTAVPQPESDWWQPAPGLAWQWQLDQPVDTSYDAAVYDVDLFETETAVIANLHASGRKVICYLSAGSWEEWRPDAAQFPDAVIGKSYDGWPGEKWLDIRQIDLLAPIMRARLDLCRDKGFDAVEPDNIDGYTNDTGFPLTYDDQLAYNIWLAEEAHARGLAIGLKNDGEQVNDLLPYFDWALTEDCFDQGWCEEMAPFIAAGKPVFAAEYTDTGITTADFCPQAAAMGFSAILKNRDLDAWVEACPTAAPPLSVAETRADGAIRLISPPPGGSDQNAAFSPDGTQIVFTRFENGYNIGPAGLFRLDLAAGDITRLTPPEDQDNVNLPGSAWNAAANRIVFASDRLEADDLWQIAPDGSDFRRITAHEGAPWYIEPSWSPDGAWIVFEADADRPDDRQQGSIWKVRADGTELTILTDGPAEGVDDRQPNWSPAGDRILFQRRDPGSDDWDIYTMAPDGSDIRLVTDQASSDTDASWSPDGRFIVYSSDYGDLPTPNISVISADGGEPARVTFSDTHEDGAPSWSPDGRFIAFESHPGEEEETPSSLWLIAAPALGEETAVAPLPALEDVRHWLYLIDVNLEPETVDQIAASAHDMVVLDFIPSEANNTDYPMAEVVAQLHHAPHPKLVIAYIDIGEAESYRTYWQPGWGIGSPEWIITGDPDGWEGNYPVAYWYDEWRDIWLDEETGLMRAILDAGFDGVYLDWVEAYSDEDVAAFAAEDGVDPRQEMIWFVGDLAEFGRARHENFIVIGQNAAELAQWDEYVEIVDAIAQEQVWFDGGADNEPPGDCPLPRTEADVDTEAYYESLSPVCQAQYDEFPESTLHVSSEEYLRDLKLAQSKGLVIFTVDYALEPENVAWVVETSRGLGFVPFVGNRALDQFVAPEP
ncbi:MAG: endo alpha-1,4 polygalactosaminidase [Anaerolineae bacterium]